MDSNVEASQVTPEPMVQPGTPTPVTPTTPKKSGGSKLFLVLVIVVVLLLLVGASAAAAMITYGYVDISNPKLKASVSNVVMAVPFMPKTAEYILVSSMNAHKDASSASIDLSIASDSKALTSMGMGSLDFQITGPVDFSDKKSPKADLAVKLSREIDANLFYSGEALYFKVNKLPTAIFAALGLGPSDLTPLLNKWVFMDIRPLDTGAREALDKQNAETAGEFDKRYQEIVDRMKKYKPVITEEAVEGVSTYKLYFDGSKGLLEDIIKESQDKIEKDYEANIKEGYGYKPKNQAEALKKLDVEMWIGKNDFYLRRVTTMVVLDQEMLGYGSYTNMMGLPELGKQEDLNVVFDLKLSKIGEKFSFNAPKNALSQDEFYQMVSEIMNNKYKEQMEAASKTTPPASLRNMLLLQSLLPTKQE